MSMKMFVDKKHQHGHTRENNYYTERVLKVEKVGKVHSNCKSY